MKHTLFYAFTLLTISTTAQSINPYSPDGTRPQHRSGMELIFNEEFNYKGKPDSTIWGYETGFKRNEELQWYQSDNANCSDGRLLIECKKANFANPNYRAGCGKWTTNRETVNYTSASINSEGKRSWKFGRFEVRARIDTTMGAWPAIWTLGVSKEWPWCGEIDIMEFYRANQVPSILANVVSGTDKRWTGKWDSSQKPLATLLATDKNWVKKYHVWRMDWSKDSINLYVDNLLLNTTLLTETINPDGSSPFLQPQYILLNLAIGSNGGDPVQSTFPITFEVDYVRIYQQTTTKNK